MSEPVPNKSKQRNLAVRVFAYCINKLWLLLATVIILAALLHIALGLLVPKIDRYNQEITNWVKQNYDLTIDISELSAEWDIHGPSLTLRDFQIKSADGAYNLLRVKNVSVDVDLLASFFDRRISTENITINGADIQFYISSELGVALTNETSPSALDSIGLESVSQQLFDALFGQRRITIVNSNLSLFTLAGTEFKYLIDELEVIKFDDIHQLFGRLSYTGGGDVTLVSEVYGDPTTESSYSNVYLEGSQIDIAQLPWVNMSPEYTPKHGNLSWKFWGSWKEKHWQAAKVIVELDNATLGEQVLQSNQISTMISWEHQDIENGYMAIHNTKFKTADLEQASADSLASFSRVKNTRTDWDFFITNLKSKPISDYMQSVLEAENPLSVFFKKTQAETSVENMHVSLTKRQKIWQPLTFELEFSELSLDAYESIPDLKKINGKIRYTDNSGELILSAENTELILPELFRHSIQANSLSAQMLWHVDENQELKVDIEDFQLTNKDFQLAASASFQQLDGEPILSLYTELHNASVANKSLYLPVGVMTEELVSYLDSSIKTGTLSLAKSFVRGPVSNFPFDSVDGVFVASGDVRGATYQYLPDWPTATSLDARLIFEGSMMDITASYGESLGNKVNFARAFAGDLSKDNALLELELSAISQDNSGRNFIKETPLDFLYDAIKDIDYQGSLASQIGLTINLDNPEQIKVDGLVEFSKEASLLQTPVVSAKNLLGKLKFTEDGLSASNLKANYFNRTLDLTVQSGRTSQDPVLSIDIKGKLPVEGITHFIGERWKPFFNGESDFTSLIQFAPADSPESTRVLFQTDFKGMQLDFPGQFGKDADTASETYLTLNLDELSKGEIKWGDISGNWFWKDSSFTSSSSNTRTVNAKPEDADLANTKPSNSQLFDAQESIINKDTSAPTPNSSGTLKVAEEKKQATTSLEYGGDFYVNAEKSVESNLKPGLRVLGNLESESLDQWLDFISKLEQQEPSNNSSDFELIFEQIELQLEKLDAGITRLESVNLKLNKLSSQPWRVAVNNEQMDGSITLNEFSPWFVDVKRADLIIGEAASGNDDTNTQANTFSPLQLDDIDIKCTECYFNRVNYGEILAEIRQVPYGVSILGQMNKAQEHKVSVSAFWFETEDSNQETQVLVELNSDNIGKFLKQWELDATVEDSSGRVIANTWWYGAPWQMDYKYLNGDFQLALGKGYLSEISDEQGRLFSLFNLQSILRKLTFDFKDVYKKGFFYDSIDGTIRMRDGVVSTENVEIEGNVADVKLFGYTDLREETIDQTAVITPHLTSSFPVLAAWAVEPTTGLLVFLLDKIMEPAVEVATRLDYRISGTFDEVVVEEMKRAKKKVKVEYSSEQPPADKPQEELESINSQEIDPPKHESESLNLEPASGEENNLKNNSINKSKLNEPQRAKDKQATENRLKGTNEELSDPDPA